MLQSKDTTESLPTVDRRNPASQFETYIYKTRTKMLGIDSPNVICQLMISHHFFHQQYDLRLRSMLLNKRSWIRELQLEVP